MKSWLSRTFGRPIEKGARQIDDPNLHCSFCNKHRQEVRKLIAGPSVYICDECLGLCVNILDEEEPTGTYLAELALGRLAALPPHTRHSIVTPRLRAAIEIAAGTPLVLRRVIALAMRFEDRATALAALAAIPTGERSVSDQLNAIAILADFDRHGDALSALDALDATTLSGFDLTLYQLHRAYAELERGGTTRVQLAVHRKTALDASPAIEGLPAGVFQDSVRGERLAVLSLSLLGLGELDEALAVARERTVLQPQNGSAHDVLSRVHAARGDRDAAVVARNAAIEHAHPDGLLARKLHATASGPFR